MASTVWRGYISFGLISIPVRLFRAARAERTSLKRLYRPADSETRQQSANSTAAPFKAQAVIEAERDAPMFRAPRELLAEALAPVRSRSVLPQRNEIVPEQAVVKGFEYEKGRFVVVEPEELKAAAAQTSSSMEIEEFVPLSEIDPVYFETSYYISPEEAGEKAYALLFRSLKEIKLVAIAKLAMHGREHVAVLRPGTTGLLAHTMFFEEEVRHDDEYSSDTTNVTPKELQLAETLIRSLTATFDPGKYHDTYRERLQAIIDDKLKGVAAAPTPAPKQSKVVDIAEALRQSLANLKKPPGSAPESEAAQPRPKTRKASQTK